MALPNISFTKGQGGLGRSLPGQDFISALCFYTGSLPSGFSASVKIKTFYALSDAVAAGILNDYSDATAATFTYLITAAGATGDIIKITSTEPNNNIVTLASYTKLVADSTIPLLGASIAAAINANTITNGYSASFTTATLTVTSPRKLGLFINLGTPIIVTITGTIAGTITQPSGGVASKLAVYYYHIAEFFRIAPKGVLYVGFFAVPSTYDFTEITTIQNFSNGTIRQIGIFKDSASVYVNGDLTLISAVCAANDVNHKNIQALYAADLSGTVDITTLTDLNLLSANKVSAVISQDGGGQGNYLWLTTGKSVTTLGTLLGTIALSSVSQSIAWVGSFNISNGVECEILGFANGQLFSTAAITDNMLDSMNTKRYVFLKKFVGISGSWWNDSHTATVITSDYAQIENNRTIDKAIRGIYSTMLPALNSPILLNSDGTISEISAAYFTALAESPLQTMVRNTELSAFQAVVNPSQNVLSTSKIIVAVALVINGVARQISIPIGFKPLIA